MAEKIRIIVVCGAGAAGYFAAIQASAIPDTKVLLLEASSRPLAKVAISGGGRCNVTHHCFDPAELIKNYPRGSKELRGPLARFQPRDTISWFESRGVQIKAEPDGRMFPVSNSSQSVIDALQRAASEQGVELHTRTKIRNVSWRDDHFRINLGESDGLPTELSCDALILATGSASGGYRIAESFGHSITPLAPSLFTFKIASPLLEGLPGTSFPSCALRLEVPGAKPFHQQGPLLITHWGLSGPAVLKLSAWAARELAASGYNARLSINWLGSLTYADALQELKSIRTNTPTRSVSVHPLAGISKRFWERVVELAGITRSAQFANLSNAHIENLAELLTKSELTISGKGEFKDEFVTCGGVSLREVDFRTMESKKQPRLYFAGEILDIDGITGGFNFQNAWTTGWIAGNAAGVAPAT